MYHHRALPSTPVLVFLPLPSPPTFSSHSPPSLQSHRPKVPIFPAQIKLVFLFFWLQWWEEEGDSSFGWGGRRERVDRVGVGGLVGGWRRTMPICRHQIRGEFGLADPELYRAADRDDPEAVLEGVAMAGLVGVLRQLGDLAEFAAEIFHDLHEEVMATAARGHGLMLRVQQLEEEFPSMEKSFLTHTSQLQNASLAGFEWHANLRVEQSLVASGDLPRFIMDSYEECRGPPRLFLLDKFDVAGAGACLKRYSDPSFFKTELSSGNMKADVQKEKKIRKLKRKGMHYKGGDGPDFFTSSEFSSMLQDGRFNELSNFSGKNTFHVVKLKGRNFIDHSSNSRNKKLYMEQIFKVPSPELKPVYEKSLVYSSLESASFDNNEADDEMHEIILMDLPIKETPVERNGRNTKPTSIDHNHELVRGHGLSVPPESVNEFKTVQKVPTLSEARPKDVIVDGYNSDSNTSGVDNFMDALATMDSELEASLQNRLKSEKSLLSIPRQGLDSDSNDEQAEFQDHLTDSYSAGSSSVSYEWKEALKKKGSSRSTSDTPSSVDELFSSNENSSRVNFASDNPSSLPVDSQHDKLTSAVQVPNEASSQFLNTDSAPDHPEHILVSPQVLSTSDEDHTSDLSSAGKVNRHMVAGKNLSGLSSCIVNAAENVQTLDSVGRTDATKFSSLGDNTSENQNTSKCYETSVNAELVGDPSHSEIVVNKLIENNWPFVEEKPNLLMDRDASQKESISLSLPQSDSVDSHGLNILEMKNDSQFAKSVLSKNTEDEKESTSVNELEDVSEPEVPTSGSKIPKDEDSPQVLTDESEHIHFHEVSGDQLIVDDSEVLDENDTLKLYSVPDVSISVMNEEPKVINNINLHDRVDTDKCGSGREVLSGLSFSEEHEQLDKVGVICSIPMVSSGGNDSCREYTSEGISGQQKPETTELVSLDPSSSYLNKVDPVTTGFSDEIVNESKVEEVASSVTKNYERDAPVGELPLSGSTLMMHDSLILNSSSGSVDLSYQLATDSHLYSINTLETPTSLTEIDKDTEFPQHTLPSTTDALDTVHDSVIGNDTRFISSTKPKMNPEVDATSPTSLPVLPGALSDLESGKGNSVCPQEPRLEYSCEDSGKVELPECPVETPKAGPSNHVAEEPSDNIYFKQSAEGMFQDSDVHPGHPIDAEEACQQNHELPNGRNLKCSADVEIPLIPNENYLTSGSHSSHMSSYVYLEHNEGLDQILERQISDEISQKKVDDAIALKYSFQVMKQTSKDANSSALQAGINNHGMQTVQQQSEAVPIEFVESLTEKVPVRLHQHTLEDPCEGLDPNSRGDLDTMPPLPPLPPLQWRSGKLQQGFSNFLIDEGSSTLSFSPPLDASEDSRPHDFQASTDTNSLLANPFIDELITKEADDSEPMIMSSKSLLSVTESRNVEHVPLGIKEQTSLAINPFGSLGHEEPQHGPNKIGGQYVPEVSPMHAGTDEEPHHNLVSPGGKKNAPEVSPKHARTDEEPHHNLVTPGGRQNAPEASPKQTGTDEEPDPHVVTSKMVVEPSDNSFASIWIEENERPASRMVLPRRKDPLIEAVAAHDRSKLRKVSDRVRSETKSKTDDRNSLLEQIRTKSFNLKPAATTRPNIQGPKTNLNVVAILEKANAIRQALAGSDDDDDETENWSDS